MKCFDKQRLGKRCFWLIENRLIIKRVCKALDKFWNIKKVKRKLDIKLIIISNNIIGYLFLRWI